MHGSWKIKGDEIKMVYTRLVAGDDLGFDANGRPIDGIERGTTYTILDALTIKNGEHYYNKEH